MHKEFLMGNAAIALGAVAAGVNVVAGYPGTPSTEVLETVAKNRPDDVYVEWSVNEKAAMELAAGAAYAGARSMVTMKQVGLNVASDPLMSLEYVGIKGGMVILVADDPGPISSQTEQDTRHFSRFSKLPCFDPSSAQEAYEMIQEAFEYSEEYGTPVFLRPTTRVCHGYASVTVKDEKEFTQHKPEGFIKDSKRWVIFPRLSFMNHQKIEARNRELSDVFSSYDKNKIHPSCETFKDSKKGIATGGISYTYAMETLKNTGMVKNLKVATPHPFPEKLAVEFLTGLDEVLCLEELDPVIERELTYICGKYHLPVKIRGKLSGDTACAGENTRDSVTSYINTFLGLSDRKDAGLPVAPELPVRPPVLCAGCPHRASFYAVKKAMKGKKTIFCGDIGCYTLGNAMPLDMVDTCLCMGAGLNIAQGVEKVEPDTTCFAFVGDSTFFASAITGVVNAVYNQANMVMLRMSNIDVYVTGSNSKFLSSDIVTEFRGRGDEIRIYPLSFAEFYSVYDGDYDDAWDDYMIYGGLPQIVSFQSERQKADYLKNIFANVYLKDVIERNKIQNVDEIGILVDVLASAIGAPTNPSKIANTFASERQMTYANKTISKHIDHLTDAFLISKASRYDIKGRKYIGANLKYYFTDLGLRNARLNFRQQEPTHIMENIVYNELLIRGYNVDVGVVDIFDKDKEGKRVRKQLEVDFVVNQGNQRYYIQVAYDMTSEEKQTQEFNSLRNIPDSFKKIVIVNGSKKPWRNDEGFVIMGMKYFLLNANSLEF